MLSIKYFNRKDLNLWIIVRELLKYRPKKFFTRIKTEVECGVTLKLSNLSHTKKSRTR